jgi:hypothetical protein
MAEKKKEEEEKKKKKKTKQKRTRRKVDYISNAHGRNRDRNAIEQSNDAQFSRNKANFVERRNMFKKSLFAKNLDAGRLDMKDLKEINEHFAGTAKNKTTMVKNMKLWTKKAKRKRPVEKKNTKTKITIKVKPLKDIKVETDKEKKKRKEKEKKSGIKLNNRYGVKL